MTNKDLIKVCVGVIRQHLYDIEQLKKRTFDDAEDVQGILEEYFKHRGAIDTLEELIEFLKNE